MATLDAIVADIGPLKSSMRGGAEAIVASVGPLKVEMVGGAEMTGGKLGGLTFSGRTSTNMNMSGSLGPLKIYGGFTEFWLLGGDLPPLGFSGTTAFQLDTSFPPLKFSGNAIHTENISLEAKLSSLAASLRVGGHLGGKLPSLNFSGTLYGETPMDVAGKLGGIDGSLDGKTYNLFLSGKLPGYKFSGGGILKQSFSLSGKLQPLKGKSTGNEPYSLLLDKSLPPLKASMSAIGSPEFDLASDFSPLKSLSLSLGYTVEDETIRYSRW